MVMHSGNIGLSQDLDRLLDAAELLREHPSVRIVIAGEGAGRGRLAAEIGLRKLENVKLIGYQPRTGLSESLGMADLHVVSLLPDLAGCIVPSKVYGIMAAGRPFLAATRAVGGTSPDRRGGTVRLPGRPRRRPCPGGCDRRVEEGTAGRDGRPRPQRLRAEIRPAGRHRALPPAPGDHGPTARFCTKTLGFPGNRQGLGTSSAHGCFQGGGRSRDRDAIFGHGRRRLHRLPPG